MADKLTPTTLTSMSNEAAFIAALNANFTAIANKLDTLVSRDGDTPNQMTANLDMNSKRIINLPAPLSDNEPMRAGDVVEGNVIQFLASAEQAALDAATAEAGALAAQQAAEDAAASVSAVAVNALRADYEVGNAITDPGAFRTAISAVSTTAFAAGTGVTASSWRTALSLYTQAQVDAAIAAAVGSAGCQTVAAGRVTDGSATRDLLGNITVNSYSKNTATNTCTWRITVTGLATPFTADNFIVNANGSNLTMGAGTRVDDDTLDISGFYPDNGGDATSMAMAFSIIMAP